MVDDQDRDARDLMIGELERHGQRALRRRGFPRPGGDTIPRNVLVGLWEIYLKGVRPPVSDCQREAEAWLLDLFDAGASMLAARGLPLESRLQARKEQP